MSSIYNEYLTGTDREIAIIHAEYAAQIAKLNVLFEAVDATLEANMLAAEAKVFAESGTYDDLTMLYTEAQADASEKKVGIIRSIINAIVTFFRNIKAKLTGQKVATPDQSVTFDEETSSKLNLFEKSWANIQSGVNKIKSNGILAGAEDLLKGLAPWIGTGVAATTVATVTMKHKEIQAKINELAEKSDIVHSIMTTITNFLNMFKKDDNVNEQSDKDDGVTSDKLGLVDKVTKAIKKFTDWVVNLMNKLRSFITGNKSDSSDDADTKGNATNSNESDDSKKDDTKTDEPVKESTSLMGFEFDEMFSESVMSEAEFNHVMNTAIINTINDKNLVITLIEESMGEYTEDDIITEGVHMDLAEQHKQDLRDFYNKVHQIKKHIRKREFAKAKALVADTTSIIKNGKKIAVKYIKSVDKYDLISTAFGQIFNIICRLCRNILLVLFAVPFAAVKMMIEEIQDIIYTIQNIIDKLRNGEKIEIKDFDTYFVHVEKSYDRMANVMSAFATKIKNLSKENDIDDSKTIAKESTSEIIDVLDSDDLFTESAMSEDDYNELRALFADM